MTTEANQIYSFVEQQLTLSHAGFGGLPKLVCTKPIVMPPQELKSRQSRSKVYSDFFKTCLEIFRQSIKGERSSRLSNLLINDSRTFLPPNFHSQLPSEAWTIPLFFRTDEAASGEVYEIQCPGSGWGDLPLLEKFYGQTGHQIAGQKNSSQRISQAIQRICSKQSPSVMHLLDNSSNPGSMRYLMTETQPPIRYWGLNETVTYREIDFVRSHSVFGLVSENLFRERLKHCASGKLLFDLPPLIVFDQKMILTLPFYDETREEFSDAVRQAIAYCYPLTDEGFRDDSGEWITIDDFLARKPSERRYFLKYGGCDTNINWGSRAVFRLDQQSSAKLLKTASEDFRSGRPWIIQKAISEKTNVSFFEKNGTKTMANELTSKYSFFYGPEELIGGRATFRKFYKVHGQADAVTGLLDTSGIGS